MNQDYVVVNQVKNYESTEKHFHRGGNIYTAVIIFPPRWKYSHRGGNIITAVDIISSAVEILSPRWKYFHHGGNVFRLIHNFSLDS